MRGTPTATTQTTLNIHIRQALFLYGHTAKPKAFACVPYRDDIPDGLLDDIARTLTIENPKYQEAEKAGRWTGGIAKFLSYYELRANDKDDKYLVIPRGFLPSLLKLCQQYQVRWELRDYTHTCDPVDFNSNIQLRDYQHAAVEAAIEKGGGVIVSPAGSGKTVMGLEIIARL